MFKCMNKILNKLHCNDMCVTNPKNTAALSQQNRVLLEF
jgi:hypothetical protein